MCLYSGRTNLDPMHNDTFVSLAEDRLGLREIYVCGVVKSPPLVLPHLQFQLMQTIFSLRSIAYGALTQPYTLDTPCSPFRILVTPSAHRDRIDFQSDERHLTWLRHARQSKQCFQVFRIFLPLSFANKPPPKSPNDPPTTAPINASVQIII